MPSDSFPYASPSASILCVEPDNIDRDSLNEILARPSWPMCPDMRWELDARSSVEAAAEALPGKHIPILICESRTDAGTWREMLDVLASLEDPPLLIVASRAADERLWAEALNLGAYDVLSKPYNGDEVVRVISVAWMTWQMRHAGNREASAAGLPLTVRGPAPRRRN
jgi:DNA-binding NtrC family response regulator